MVCPPMVGRLGALMKETVSGAKLVVSAQGKLVREATVTFHWKLLQKT